MVLKAMQFVQSVYVRTVSECTTYVCMYCVGMYCVRMYCVRMYSVRMYCTPRVRDSPSITVDNTRGRIDWDTSA
jgi:hypothetical protein